MLERSEILNRFIGWAKLKVRIHFSNRKIFPKDRGIWWASLGQNIGVEINGKNENFERPVLVIKNFNNESILVLPISSRGSEDQYRFEFVNKDGQKNIMNLSQIRAISSKRLIRKVGKLTLEDYVMVKERVKNLL